MLLKAIIREDRITWCHPPFWVIGFLALTAAAFLIGGTLFLRLPREAAAGGLAGWVAPIALLAAGCVALAGMVQLARKTARGEPITSAWMDASGVAVRTAMLGGRTLSLGLMYQKKQRHPASY